MDMKRYTALFLAEAEDHLRQGEELVHRLEADGSAPDALNGLFRHLHSLKGMAATMGFGGLARIAHALEDLLDRNRRDAGACSVPPDDLALVSNGLGYIQAMVRAVEDGKPAENADAASLVDLVRSRLDRPEPSPPRAVPAQEPVETVRGGGSRPRWRIELRLDSMASASTGQVVELVNRLGDLGSVRHFSPPLPSTARQDGERIILELESGDTRERLEEGLQALEMVREYRLTAGGTARRVPDGSRRPARFVRVRADLLDVLMENALELTLAHQELGRQAGNDLGHGLWRGLQRCRQLVENQYGALTELRLVPFETVSNRIQAGVDSLAVRMGKTLNLRMDGRMVRMDRSILEALVDPLLHIIRNAVDHGIEDPEERRAAGKPAAGTVSLRLTRRGNTVRFTISDDGRGMDVEQLRRRAVELNLMSAGQAARLTDGECHFLVTLPGFSTAGRIDETSGRGVGMDVVRSQVESLGGRLEIESTPGHGTRFALEIPQSMAIIQALLVRFREELFAIPAASVSRTIPAPHNVLTRVDGQLFIRLGDGSPDLPAVAADGEDINHRTGECVALLPARDRDQAILVDEVLGRRELLVRPLDPPLRMMRRYSGAALLGDGRIALVLDSGPGVR